jgi:hypothetical protein
MGLILSDTYSTWYELAWAVVLVVDDLPSSAMPSPQMEPLPPVQDRAARSTWQQQAFARVVDIGVLLRWLVELSPRRDSGALYRAVVEHLADAQEVAARRVYPLLKPFNQSRIERVTLHLDAAEINLLRLAPEPYLRSILPNILADARQSLRNSDPRLDRLSSIAARVEKKEEPLTGSESNLAIATLQAVRSKALYNQMRVRSFQNIILAVTLLIIVFVIGLAMVGFMRPELLPLCFTSRLGLNVACPTSEQPTESLLPATSPTTPTPPSGAPPTTTTATSAAASEEQLLSVSRLAARPQDILVVEFIGTLSATVAAAAALRRIRGSPDPYSLPFALALLKLPTGALTAFLGLTILRAAIIPGVDSLDSSAQILFYAVLFGYSQEIFTGLVDRQAQVVLAGNEGTDRASEATIRRAHELAREPSE